MVASYQEEHSKGIGSGEIAAVCGIDPYKSRLQVWAEKTGLDEPEQSSWHIDRGNFLERGCLRWLAKRTGHDFYPGVTFRHGLVIATPDGTLPGGSGPNRIAAVGEIKCPSSFAAMSDWGDDGSGADGVPPKVLTQVHWEMAATETELAYVGALIDGFLRVYRVEFDTELFTKLLTTAEWFWKFVESKEEPPVDGGDAGAEWLKRRFPVREGARDMLDLTALPENFIDRYDDIAGSYFNYREAYRTRKFAEVTEQTHANELKQLIGEHGGLAGPLGKITWSDRKATAGVRWRDLAHSLMSDRSEPEREELQKRFIGETRKAARVFRPYWKKGS